MADKWRSVYPDLAVVAGDEAVTASDTVMMGFLRSLEAKKGIAAAVAIRDGYELETNKAYLGMVVAARCCLAQRDTTSGARGRSAKTGGAGELGMLFCNSPFGAGLTEGRQGIPDRLSPETGRRVKAGVSRASRRLPITFSMALLFEREMT